MAQVSVRHSLLVRMTHWINTLAFLSLTVSGAAILMAHPRLYWGETGAFGSPALLELPIPFNLDQSGWGRSLHFLSAWICVLNGLIYVLSGLILPLWKRKLSRPSKAGVSGRCLPVVPADDCQRTCMSPAVMAALPFIVSLFGGHQSARTIHFFVTNLLVVFLVGHLVMVYMAGFGGRMRGMITAAKSH